METKPYGRFETRGELGRCKGFVLTMWLVSVIAASAAAEPPDPGQAAGGNVAREDAAPAAAEACFPQCRSGFLCHQGECISACNPACPTGQHCTATAECMTDAVQPYLPYAHPRPQSQATVQEPSGYDGGAQRHDSFMFRVTLGLGGAFTHVDPQAAPSFLLSGLSGGFSVDIGGSVLPNLVIHGRFSRLGIFSPSASGKGKDIIDGNDITSSAYLVGAGVSYYFMPINVYVTGALGLSWLTLYYANGDKERSAVAGPGANIDVGKEWWLSDSWGLGIGARFWHTALEDRNRSLPIDVEFNGFAVLLSATCQ